MYFSSPRFRAANGTLMISWSVGSDGAVNSKPPAVGVAGEAVPMPVPPTVLPGLDGIDGGIVVIV